MKEKISDERRIIIDKVLKKCVNVRRILDIIMFIKTCFRITNN